MMTSTWPGATLPVQQAAGRKDRLMTEQTPVRQRSAGTGDRSGRWAVGLAFFAAIMLLLSGTAQFFTGLSAVLGNTPYAFNASNQLLDLGLASWGWVHLIVGVVLVAAGAMLLTGQRWARVWALTVIALDVLVIWALTAHGDEIADR
jgi:hypothetical protein